MVFLSSLILCFIEEEKRQTKRQTYAGAWTESHAVVTVRWNLLFNLPFNLLLHRHTHAHTHTHTHKYTRTHAHTNTHTTVFSLQNKKRSPLFPSYIHIFIHSFILISFSHWSCPLHPLRLLTATSSQWSALAETQGQILAKRADRGRGEAGKRSGRPASLQPSYSSETSDGFRSFFSLNPLSPVYS